MTDPETTTEPTRPRPRGGWVPVFISLAVALVVVAGGVAHQFTLPPLRGRENADPMTVQLAGLAHLVARVAMVGTFGLLLAGAYFTPVVRRHHELSERGRQVVGLATHTAAAWFGASVLEVVLVAGENNGVPVTEAVRALPAFISATQAASAWIVPAAIALVVMLTARHLRSLGAVAAILGLGVVWQLAPVLTGNVSVGADHDFGSDMGAIASITSTALLAAGIAWLAGDADDDQASPRYHLIAAITVPFVVLSYAVVLWYEMAGTSLWASGYGLLRLAAIVLWALVGVRVLTAVRRGSTRRLVGWDLALGLVASAADVATAHMAPPRFLVPQTSAQINYLGYEVPNPPTIPTLLAPGRPNLLLMTLVLLVIVAYWAGVVVLRRRGVAWSWVRTASWTVGWLVLGWIATAGIWSYSSATFSKHMLVHMTINMIGPVLIVLGAPSTLALRALPTHRDGQLAGAREIILGVLDWRPMEVFLHPILVGINFVASFYVIYFSDLFGFLMRYHWGHQLMTFHFLISGLAFFGLVVGADRMPKELPHIAKLGFLFAAMPFHAFFAVAILSGDDLIAPDFYRSLDLPWMHDLLEDQRIGGQFTWALGEVPMLMVVIALVIQWFVHDNKEARRRDRAMDEGHDDAYEAYNDMLRQLSERSEK
ncbi:cytochrome c oxidase assembly protein [Mariniluteicoccus endophyticus]